MSKDIGSSHPYRTNGVFLNVPFDKEYEDSFVALIAAVAGMGLLPASVLEVPASRQRLERIFQHLGRCRYSIHDLSRVELSRGRYPRFNMPFEAGMATALALTSRRHERFLFEARRYRLARTCSDLNGVDVKIHRARPSGMLRAVLNTFVRPRQKPEFFELWTLYQALRARARELKRELGTIYEAYPFRELAAAAIALAMMQRRARRARGPLRRS